MPYAALVHEGLLLHPASHDVLAVLDESAGWQLWDQLDPRTTLRVLDSDGDWLDRAELRMLPDGKRGLYHDDLEGFQILSEAEIEELFELGAMVRDND